MGEMEEKRKSTKSKRRREEYETANLRRSNRIQTLEEEKMGAVKVLIQLKGKRKARGGRAGSWCIILDKEEKCRLQF